MAAVDMYGSRGSTARRRLILAEFVLAAIVLPLTGVSTMASATSAVWALLGAYLVGAGLNYLPLAVHAISLSCCGRLGTCLAAVDVRAELQRYSVKQLLIGIPLFVLILGIVQLSPGHRSSRSIGAGHGDAREHSQLR